MFDIILSELEPYVSAEQEFCEVFFHLRYPGDGKEVLSFFHLLYIFIYSFWTPVNRGSYEIAIVCPSVRPSVQRFAQKLVIFYRLIFDMEVSER